MWNVSNIFNIRDKIVYDKMNKPYNVSLVASGWAIGEYKGMDIWEACRLLNDMEIKDIAQNLF